MKYINLKFCFDEVQFADLNYDCTNSLRTRLKTVVSSQGERERERPFKAFATECDKLVKHFSDLEIAGHLIGQLFRFDSLPIHTAAQFFYGDSWQNMPRTGKTRQFQFVQCTNSNICAVQLCNNLLRAHIRCLRSPNRMTIITAR